MTHFDNNMNKNYQLPIIILLLSNKGSGLMEKRRSVWNLFMEDAMEIKIISDLLDYAEVNVIETGILLVKYFVNIF